MFNNKFLKESITFSYFIISLSLVCFIESCITTSYFKTANDVYKKPATIYLVNGDSVQGDITILFERGLDPVNYILLKTSQREERVLVNDIDFYKINADMFYLKLISLDGDKTERVLFVKELSRNNSKIRLFELFQQKSKTIDGKDRYLYFIATANETRFDVLSLIGTELVPNFDNKMGKLVKDCPELSEKIRDKTKGYFIPSITFSDAKTLEVITRIISEYNSCK